MARSLLIKEEKNRRRPSDQKQENGLNFCLVFLFDDSAFPTDLATLDQKLDTEGCQLSGCGMLFLQGAVLSIWCESSTSKALLLSESPEERRSPSRVTCGFLNRTFGFWQDLDTTSKSAFVREGPEEFASGLSKSP